MTQRDPSSRPSAEQALQEWRAIRISIGTLHRYWRLRDPMEPYLLAQVLDVFYVFKSIPRFLRWIGRMLRRNPAIHLG
jgi:hypothetical protein